MFKFGKFDKQLIAAFFIGISVIVTGKAMGYVEWVAKPVQCGSPSEVTELMDARNQTALFAGTGSVRVQDERYVLPYIIFANTEDGSWHVIEYNVNNDQVCVVALGDNLDFDVADWYEDTINGLQQQ